jgi:hypothetical protein
VFAATSLYLFCKLFFGFGAPFRSAIEQFYHFFLQINFELFQFVKFMEFEGKPRPFVKSRLSRFR